MSVGLWNPLYCGRNRMVGTGAVAGPAVAAGPGGASTSLDSVGGWLAASSAGSPGLGSCASPLAGPGRPRWPLLWWAGGLRRRVSGVRRRLAPGPVGDRRGAALLVGGVLPARATRGGCGVSARGGSSVSRGLVRGGAAESSRARGLTVGRRWLVMRGGRSAPSGCRGSEGLRGRLPLAGGSGLSWSLARGRRPCPLPPAGLPSTAARDPGRGAPCCSGSGASGEGSPGPGGACGWRPP